VDELMIELKDFEGKYYWNTGFKSIVDNTNDRTSSFQDNWKSFQPLFPKLVEFCGALASVFPGTSTVESHFSIIGWEKDDYCFNLTDMSLDGILHEKQSGTLAHVKEYVDRIKTKDKSPRILKLNDNFRSKSKTESDSYFYHRLHLCQPRNSVNECYHPIQQCITTELIKMHYKNNSKATTGGGTLDKN
jgi:hypothetical protein